MCVWKNLKKLKSYKNIFINLLPFVLKIYVNYIENVLYFYCVFLRFLEELWVSQETTGLS